MQLPDTDALSDEWRMHWTRSPLRRGDTATDRLDKALSGFISMALEGDSGAHAKTTIIGIVLAAVSASGTHKKEEIQSCVDRLMSPARPEKPRRFGALAKTATLGNFAWALAVVYAVVFGPRDIGTEEAIISVGVLTVTTLNILALHRAGEAMTILSLFIKRKRMEQEKAIAELTGEPWP